MFFSFVLIFIVWKFSFNGQSKTAVCQQGKAKLMYMATQSF